MQTRSLDGRDLDSIWDAVKDQRVTSGNSDLAMPQAVWERVQAASQPGPQPLGAGALAAPWLWGLRVFVDDRLDPDEVLWGDYDDIDAMLVARTGRGRRAD